MSVWIAIWAAVFMVIFYIFAEPIIESERRNMLTKRDKSLPAESRGRERLARMNPHLEPLIFQ